MLFIDAEEIAHIIEVFSYLSILKHCADMGPGMLMLCLVVLVL